PSHASVGARTIQDAGIGCELSDVRALSCRTAGRAASGGGAVPFHAPSRVSTILALERWGFLVCIFARSAAYRGLVANPCHAQDERPLDSKLPLPRKRSGDDALGCVLHHRGRHPNRGTSS